MPVVILELIEGQFTNKSKLYESIIRIIKQDKSDLTFDRLEYDFSALKQKSSLNSLKHFIEFGSARVEDFNYSIGDYKLILKNQSLLSIKKYAHNWTKNEQKLNRLLSLYTTTNERESLLDLMHIKIQGLLNEFPKAPRAPGKTPRSPQRIPKTPRDPPEAFHEFHREIVKKQLVLLCKSQKQLSKHHFVQDVILKMSISSW